MASIQSPSLFDANDLSDRSDHPAVGWFLAANLPSGLKQNEVLAHPKSLIFRLTLKFISAILCFNGLSF
jgi:hypothetical protein